MAFAMVTMAMVLGGCTDASSQKTLSISVWTYYNGDQLAAFQDLIEEYNNTVGKKAGVVVESNNLGSVDDLRDAVMNSANGKVGAEPLPNMFAAYADTAYAIDQKGMIAELSTRLTQEERAEFIEGYLEEGTLGGSNSIKIFPVAKSVELFLLNKTDFEPFAQATGVTLDDLSTIEGVTRVGQLYYEWTDAQTPQPFDGKAFFGRDSMANYFYIGAKQLGVDIVTVDADTVSINFDKATIRKLWDNYYVPFVKGYFDSTGRYRSDDIKTGNIIALVGSSSGATFFPTQVTPDSGEPYPIEMDVLACPQFEDGKPYGVQQGAGMVVIDKSEEEVEASVEFLKWFTQHNQNLKFSLQSGYLPVKKDANNIESMRAIDATIDDSMDRILEAAIAEVDRNTLYTPQAFKNGTTFREVLEYSMTDLASENARAVREAIAAGATLDEATAPYLTDETFDSWYNSTLNALELLAR